MIAALPYKEKYSEGSPASVIFSTAKLKRKKKKVELAFHIPRLSF